MTPNSSEWFEALMKINPQQAAMSAQLIEMAGSEEICSMCGDLETKDYEVVGSLPLRLCGDCRSFQKSMGTKFVE